MKKYFILSATLLLFFVQANAQVKVGVRAGMATTQLDQEEILINNFDELQELGIAISDANYGIHAGFFVQAKIKKFFIQPEFLFNSNSIDYVVTDFENGEIVESIKTESYQHMDIPIMMGFKFGPLRLQGGPVGHVFINSSSELFDISGYEQKFDEFTWGYQTGIGLDIWKLMFDVKYEGNFNNLGSHFSIKDQDFQFSQTPERIVFTLGYKF